MAMVFVIALLVFGPKRLPELGRQVGKGLRELKRQMNAVSDDVRGAIDDAEDSAPSSSMNASAQTVAAPAVEVADESDDDLLDGVVVSGATGPASPPTET